MLDFRKLRLLTVVITTLALLCALTIGAGTHFLAVQARPASNTTLPPGSVTPPASPVAEQAVIRLLTTGFSPTEVSGAAGQYRLVATRGSRDEQLTFQLKRSSGELVQELAMPQDKVDWTTLLEIGTGSYTLTVSTHQDWVCHITVQ